VELTLSMNFVLASKDMRVRAFWRLICVAVASMHRSRTLSLHFAERAVRSADTSSRVDSSNSSPAREEDTPGLHMARRLSSTRSMDIAGKVLGGRGRGGEGEEGQRGVRTRVSRTVPGGFWADFGQCIGSASKPTLRVARKNAALAAFP
jgi:hypothetical protein